MEKLTRQIGYKKPPLVDGKEDGVLSKKLAVKIELDACAKICKWLDDHEAFNVAHLCKVVDIDYGNFSRYRKMKIIPQKYLAPIIEFLKNYGYE